MRLTSLRSHCNSIQQKLMIMRDYLCLTLPLFRNGHSPSIVNLVFLPKPLKHSRKNVRVKLMQWLLGNKQSGIKSRRSILVL